MVSPGFSPCGDGDGGGCSTCGGSPYTVTGESGGDISDRRLVLWSSGFLTGSSLGVDVYVWVVVTRVPGRVDCRGRGGF